MFRMPGAIRYDDPEPERGALVAMSLADLARRLRELIAALDRRAPHAERAAEGAIARDSAALREKAVNRLAEITDQATSAPNDPAGRVG